MSLDESYEVGELSSSIYRRNSFCGGVKGMGYGEYIKQLRKSSNLTQSEFADKISFSRTYICDVERERYTPSFKLISNIATFLANEDKTYNDIVLELTLKVIKSEAGE